MRTTASAAGLRRHVAQPGNVAGGTRIVLRSRRAGPEPSSFSSSQGAIRHAIQHPDPGRGLRVAAGLQAAVRRPQDPSRLPARRGRADQRRRLPCAHAGQGPQGPGDARLRSKLPGKVTPVPAPASIRRTTTSIGLAMQEPQYRSPGVRELLDAVAKSQVPCMSIMNMPPLPYVKRIPGLDYRRAASRPTPTPTRVGQFRSRAA